MTAARRWKRWVGEFAAIVLGVLVALGVDDFHQFLENREVERNLLDRLSVELGADSADLALATRQVSARLWVLRRLVAAPDHADPTPPDSLFGVAGLDPVAEPLGAFESWPDFDLSDDAYREMLATGSLDLIRDENLRAHILAYYRAAADQGENERRVGQYQEAFEEALAGIGLAVGDPLSLADLRKRVQSDPSAPVEMRRAANRISLQLRYYGNIGRQRANLREALRASG